MTRRKTTEEFIRDSKNIHGNKYDYSKVKYINNSTTIDIICQIDGHGSFQQTPTHHLREQGCPRCAKNKLKTTENFIRDAKIKHGEKYDYSNVKYINDKTPVKIICGISRDFLQIYL